MPPSRTEVEWQPLDRHGQTAPSGRGRPAISRVIGGAGGAAGRMIATTVLPCKGSRSVLGGHGGRTRNRPTVTPPLMMAGPLRGRLGASPRVDDATSTCALVRFRAGRGERSMPRSWGSASFSPVRSGARAGRSARREAILLPPT
jgi:hypothetical protein